MIKNYDLRHALLVIIAMMTGLAWSAQAADSLPYPYMSDEQNPKSDFVGSGTAWDDWKWVDNYNGFQLMTTKNKWPSKYIISTAPVDFPATQESAQLSFWYNASQEVTVYVKHEVDGELVELGSVDLEGSGSNYVYTRIAFQANGPEKIVISAILTGGNGNCYGSLVIRDIQITPAANGDLAIASLDAPFSNRLAAGQNHPVTASFENLSGADITNTVFAYSVGEKVVRETYSGSIAAGAAFSYTFDTPLNETAGTRAEMKVWCEVEGDINPDNDSRTVGEVLFYEPATFPYFTDFNDGFNSWTIYDANGSWPWEFVTIDDNGTPNNVLGYAFSYGSYDDYAITPAISMPAGRHRISFYQAGLGGTAHLKVMCGTSPDPSKMTMTLLDGDVDNIGWANKYASFEVPEDGMYYFSFHLTGGSDQVCIDRLYIDDNEDLCIKAVDFDTTSGYNKTTAKVTLSYTNHGLTPQSGIKVRYSLDGLQTFVEETVEESVAPGETISHTFTQPVDISEKGHTYTLTGKIETPVGIDFYNDGMTGASLTHYENASAPYVSYFNNPEEVERWQFSSNADKAGWKLTPTTYPYIGSTDYYEGTQAYVMQHSNESNAKADSWAWSECIDLPAGVYDMSFFYRTPNYKTLAQDFSVAICSDASPEAEMIKVAEFKDVLHTALEYRKYEGQVTIEKDGSYYIGFNNTSESGDGGTMIDMLTLRPHVEAKQIPFESVLPDDSNDWEAYDLSHHFLQWGVSDEGISVSRAVYSQGTALYTFSEGMLVSPRIAAIPGQEVKVELEYKIESDTDQIGMCLYSADRNVPEAFRLLDAFNGRGWNVHEMTFTPSESEFYLGMRSNMLRDDDELLLPYNYKLSVRNLKVSYTKGNGIEGVTTDTLIYIEGDKVHCQGAEITVYSASGMVIADGRDMVSIDGYKGVAIIKVSDDKGSRSIKHLF